MRDFVEGDRRLVVLERGMDSLSCSEFEDLVDEIVGDGWVLLDISRNFDFFIMYFGLGRVG